MGCIRRLCTVVCTFHINELHFRGLPRLWVGQYHRHCPASGCWQRVLHPDWRLHHLHLREVHRQVIGEPTISGLEALGFRCLGVPHDFESVRERLEVYNPVVPDPELFPSAGEIDVVGGETQQPCVLVDCCQGRRQSGPLGRRNGGPPGIRHRTTPASPRRAADCAPRSHRAHWLPWCSCGALSRYPHPLRYAPSSRNATGSLSLSGASPGPVPQTGSWSRTVPR